LLNVLGTSQPGIATHLSSPRAIFTSQTLERFAQFYLVPIPKTA
jgi:hypothetical protein